MSQSILYYPTIDIKDGVWLRNALLYWDEVCSIVPYEGYTGQSPEIQYMQERGLYRAIYPQYIFWNEHSEKLKDTIIYNLSHPIKRRSKFYFNKVNRNNSTRLSSLIHHNKIPPEFMDIFKDKNIFLNNDKNEWIEMDERIATIYMKTLAEFAAKYDSQDMVIGTESQDSLNEIYNQVPHKRNMVISIILSECLPIPSMYTSFEEIIDFKMKRRDELLEFRVKLRELEQGISHCESIEELKSQIQHFKELWTLELIKANKLFKSDRIEFILGSAKTFIADAGVAAGLLQGIQSIYGHTIPTTAFAATIGASGLAGVGIKYMNYRNKINIHHNNGGFSYILNAYKYGIVRGNIGEIV